MYGVRRLSQIFNTAEQISFDDFSRIILMSDCHRGDGDWADDFSKNQNLYFAALTYYFREGYTYIELGDGDELWENRKFSDIIQEHSNIFWLLSNFIKTGRFYSLYGNHDIMKRSKGLIKSKDYKKFDERQKDYPDLFNGIKFHEGLVLKHTVSGGKILLVHGHQVDYFNYRLWRLSRFLVRHFWRPLDLLGVNDPTSTAKNYEKKVTVERRLIGWVKKENQMLIAGHTHRPMFPKVGDAPYFNDGSCIHPRCITGMEIAGGNITLVKWSIKTMYDGILRVGKDVLAGPGKIIDYINQNSIQY